MILRELRDNEIELLRDFLYEARGDQLVVESAF